MLTHHSIFSDRSTRTRVLATTNCCSNKQNEEGNRREGCTKFPKLLIRLRKMYCIKANLNQNQTVYCKFQFTTTARFGKQTNGKLKNYPLPKEVIERNICETNHVRKMPIRLQLGGRKITENSKY